MHTAETNPQEIYRNTNYMKYKPGRGSGNTDRIAKRNRRVENTVTSGTAELTQRKKKIKDTREGGIMEDR